MHACLCLASYLFGDNVPFVTAVNQIATQLWPGAGIHLKGDDPADKVVDILDGDESGGQPISTRVHDAREGAAGFAPHPITTGLVHLFEGSTVSWVAEGDSEYHTVLNPLVRGSDGHVVMATYEKEGMRVVIDGGFTRMYENLWRKTAGTSRYIANAASWLFNYEQRIEE